MLEPSQPPLTISEYLIYIKSKNIDERKYLNIERVFNNIKPMLRHFNESIGVEKDIPEIKIKFQGSLGAESTPGMIYLDENFIEFCYNLKFRKLELITLDEHLIHNFNYGWMSYIFILWVVAHEYIHIIRHASEEITKGNETTFKATEIDADVFAVTLIYRFYSEQVSSLFSSEQIKHLVIYSIFWGLRQLPEAGASLSHPRFKYRFEEMIWRIGALRKLGEAPDLRLDYDSTQKVTTELLKSFVNMEFSYIINENEIDLSNSWLFPMGLKTSPDEIDKKLMELNPILKRNLFSKYTS